MKLSTAQKDALDKLSNEPKCAYTLKVRLDTLRALVNLGLARDVTKSGPGGMFSPRTHFLFVRHDAKRT